MPKIEEIESIEITEGYSHTINGPSVWERSIFQEVCTVIGGSQPPKLTFSDQPQDGYIRLIQIRDYKSERFITYIPKDLARRFCGPEDIMIGRYGPPIFQILRGLEGAYNVALMKAEPKTNMIQKEFLYYFLKTPDLFNYIAFSSERTAGQDGIRKEHLNNYPIFIPSLQEQDLIVSKIKQCFESIDRIEQQYQFIKTELDRLDRSILAKAFKGELVPQDPTDEPAIVLLEWIRTDRASQAKPAKTKRKKA